MRPPIFIFRPWIAPALAGLLLLSGGLAVAAGVPLCAREMAMDCCPASGAMTPAAGCHDAAALATACCGAAEAPAAAAHSGAAFTQQASSPVSLTPPPPDALPRPELELLRTPARPPDDGLYTLHRSLLI